MKLSIAGIAAGVVLLALAALAYSIQDGESAGIALVFGILVIQQSIADLEERRSRAEVRR
jgi:hypothetical protein